MTAIADSQRIWKILEIIERTSAYLERKGFENPRLNSERLLAHVLGLERVGLYLNHDRPLSNAELTRFKSLLQRRVRHEPIQYLTAETEFMSLPFRVTPGVFIPRPETELLVEGAIAYCRKELGGRDTISCLDIGTGSGNIAISLAYYLPSIRVMALDCSAPSLEIARANAGRNGVLERITFIEVDVFAENSPLRKGVEFDMVLSNPPYIPSQVIRTLAAEIRDYEPRAALDGGGDGLDFFRKLAPLASAIVRPGGALFFEIGQDQGDAISQLLHEAIIGDTQLYKDLNGLDRVIQGSKRHETE